MSKKVGLLRRFRKSDVLDTTNRCLYGNIVRKQSFLRINSTAPIVYTETPPHLPPMSQSSPPTPIETPIVAPARETQRHEEARRTGLRWRRIARWLGLAFFLFGAALLIYVFLQALGGLSRLAQPGVLNADFNQIVGQSDKPAVIVQAVVSVFGAEFLRVLYLLILGYFASAIAARGIQFFAASESVIDEAVVAEDQN